jgi:hypothetical protein
MRSHWSTATHEADLGGEKPIHDPAPSDKRIVTLSERASPWLGEEREQVCTVVVLPAPFGPRKPTNTRRHDAGPPAGDAHACATTT